jgi:hypothetical protein
MVKKCIIKTILSVFGFSLYGQDELPFFVISEIMVDPMPSKALPPYEYVELYNLTDQDISLRGLRFSDEKTSVSLYGTIMANEHLLVIPSDAKEFFEEIENKIVLNKWPSLNNDQDKLKVCNRYGDTLAFLEYQVEWIDHIFDQEGGYALEMINVEDASLAFENNFHYSNDPKGGTPGEENSLVRLNEEEKLFDFVFDHSILNSPILDFQIFSLHQAVFSVSLFHSGGQLVDLLIDQERVLSNENVSIDLQELNIKNNEVYILMVQIVNEYAEIKRYKQAFYLNINEL